MVKRKAISKTMRFEVFKRDSFRCQYCGRAAPEVILHVDHITPLALGGENEIMNYVTACADCNLGKGKRALSDTSTIEKRRNQLDELNERREQLEMMIDWKNGLDELKEKTYEAFVKVYQKKIGKQITISGEKIIKKTIRIYGIDDTLKALDLAVEKENLREDGLAYIAGICKGMRNDKEKSYLKDLYTIRANLRYRLNDFDKYQHFILSYLEECYLSGIAVQELSVIAKNAAYWQDFKSTVEKLRD